jgi:spore cortex formation protein SpoVR/YcgB (stage V sporulation)
VGFWTWFWIWLSLGAAALVVLTLVGKSLFNKLGDAAHQVERMASQAQTLANALENKPTVERPSDSVLANPAVARARLLALRKAKVKKHEKRQRRLIASLKRFDPNESRFH